MGWAMLKKMYEIVLQPAISESAHSAARTPQSVRPMPPFRERMGLLVA
jgi:hypothetical protein